MTNTKISENSRHEIVIKNSVIKGYHVYQIHPPMTNPPTRLRVDLEYTNLRDENASLIWVPNIDTFDNEFHKLITDQKRFLYLSDIAGLPVGHAPWGLSSAFRKLLENNCDIHAEPTDDPIPSFPPWPPVQEKGGGVVIPCTYIITCQQDEVDDANDLIMRTLNEMPEREAMSVEIRQIE